MALLHPSSRGTFIANTVTGILFPGLVHTLPVANTVSVLVYEFAAFPMIQANGVCFFLVDTYRFSADSMSASMTMGKGPGGKHGYSQNYGHHNNTKFFHYNFLLFCHFHS